MNTLSKNSQHEIAPPIGEDWLVCALYKFVSLDDHTSLREPILSAAQEAGLCGTLLLAHEGINGTIAGQEEKMRGFLDWLKTLRHNEGAPFGELEWKESTAAAKPFNKLKVRLKKEIVTMGIEDIDPKHIVGTYVKPQDWNELISREETTVIDTRNDYEVAIGTFEGAVDPKTEAFGEFPQWADQNLPQDKAAPIAMFCTGGIRCEKSTALLKQRGYENVYHLQGGILKYLEEVEEDDSMWQGECFVFDKRVSVGHGLKEGPHSLCYACGRPLTQEDRASELYEKGVSCPNCAGQWSEKASARFRARQKRIEENQLPDIDSKSQTFRSKS